MLQITTSNAPYFTSFLNVFSNTEKPGGGLDSEETEIVLGLEIPDGVLGTIGAIEEVGGPILRVATSDPPCLDDHIV